MNDKKILDYLKERGVDTTKLMNKNSSSVDDTSDDSDTDESPVATPTPQATPSSQSGPISNMELHPEPILPSMMPSAKLDNNNFGLLLPPLPPADSPVTTPPVFDLAEHKKLLNAGINDSKGPSPAAIPAIDPDDEDEDDTDGNGSTKSKISFGAKGSVLSAQRDALQAAINANGFTNNTVEGLKAAQDESNGQKSQINLLRGIAQIAQGGAGMNFKAKDVNIDNTLANLKGLDKQADDGVTEFKDRGEQEKNDPKSALSVSARAFAAPLLAKMGMNLPDNVSFSGMEKLNPNLTKLYDAQEAREAKSSDMEYKYSVLNEMKKQGQVANDDKLEQKLAMAEKDDLDPNKARGGNLAKSQAVVNASDRVNALFQQFPDYNIPKSQTVELATATAAMISGGSPQSQQQIEHLIPASVLGKGIDGISEWLGKPEGRQQQEFMKMMHDTANREKTVAQQQVLTDQLQRLGAHQVISRRFPDTHSQILNSYGITPEMLAAYKKTGKVPLRNDTSTSLTTPSGVSSASAAPSSNPGAGHSPGDIIMYNGKQYKLGADGNSMDPI